MSSFPHRKGIIWLLFLGSLLLLGSVVVYADLAKAWWGSEVGQAREVERLATTDKQSVAASFIVSMADAGDIATGVKTMAGEQAEFSAEQLADLLQRAENLVVPEIAKLPDGAEPEALRVLFANWQGDKKLFAKSAVAGGVQQASRDLIWQAHELLRRQRAIARELSSLANDADVSSQINKLFWLHSELNGLAAPFGIQLDFDLPTLSAAAAAVNKNTCCNGNADCGACFDLSDTDADGSIAAPFCNACQQYGGVGQHYDLAVADLIVDGEAVDVAPGNKITFQVVLRNDSSDAAPVDLDFFWDGELIHGASLSHIIVRPGQQFTTAELRPITLLVPAKIGKHSLEAVISHPYGHDINQTNDSQKRIIIVSP